MVSLEISLIWTRILLLRLPLYALTKDKHVELRDPDGRRAGGPKYLRDILTSDQNPIPLESDICHHLQEMTDLPTGWYKTQNLRLLNMHCNKLHGNITRRCLQFLTDRRCGSQTLITGLHPQHAAPPKFFFLSPSLAKFLKLSPDHGTTAVTIERLRSAYHEVGCLYAFAAFPMSKHREDLSSLASNGPTILDLFPLSSCLSGNQFRQDKQTESDTEIYNTGVGSSLFWGTYQAVQITVPLFQTVQS